MTPLQPQPAPAAAPPPAGPHCPGCGYPLGDLGSLDACPECGRPTPRRLYAARCVRCAYPLAGLDAAALCPECAHPAADSLSARWAHFSGPQFLLGIRSGCVMIALGCVAGFGVMPFLPVFLAGPALLSIGMILATSLDPRPEGRVHEPTRIGVRALLGASAGLLLAAVAGYTTTRSLRGMPLALLVLALLAWLAAVFCACVYLGRLATTLVRASGGTWRVAGALLAVALLTNAVAAVLSLRGPWGGGWAFWTIGIGLAVVSVIALLVAAVVTALAAQRSLSRVPVRVPGPVPAPGGIPDPEAAARE
ncbi:MAG TPA: hypothetical protein VD963_11475 [Phycisphaerales bacterium]|nr:hypothetical protein [Phycisphaerales bacterium]